MPDLASHAFYDRTLGEKQAFELLSRLQAKKDKKVGAKTVYRTPGRVWIVVESAGAGKLRVRQYAGGCPC